MTFAITGANIFDGHRVLKNHALVVDGGHVARIVSNDSMPKNLPQQKVSGGTLTPGFFDLQINGAGGILFNNAPTVETLEQMSNTLLKFGVTSFLPTVISDDSETTVKAIEAALEGVKTIPGVAGIHIEGPFFSTDKKGVHQQESIRSLDEADWQWLEQLSSLPSLLTLAPEIVDADSIERLASMGIKICAGHTNANYETIKKAANHGLTGFTHLYNAMSGMTGRKPGVVGAALDLKGTWAGIIADGIHVHDASLRSAIVTKQYEKIFLVSDAMATLGSDEKSFQLYGETIDEKDGMLINQEGKLAGSAISVLDAIQYCYRTLGLPFEQVLTMATRVPAEFMGLKTLGTLTPGSQANICLLNKSLELEQVWQAGELVTNGTLSS